MTDATNDHEIKTDSQAETTIATIAGFVGHERLLELIWPDEKARPSVKWLHHQRANRQIPYIRVGRLIFYDPVRVKASLLSKREIKSV